MTMCSPTSSTSDTDHQNALISSSGCTGERNACRNRMLAWTVSRRMFLRGVVGGAMSLSLTGLLAACSSSDDGPPATEITIPSGDVPDVDGPPYRSADGHFYLVHNTDGVLAFSWTCTHQGCMVPWKEGEEQFRCPCHGSVFDINGVNVEGPAERPLDLVMIEVSGNGDLTVNPRTTRKRDTYDPLQAVAYPSSGASVVSRSAMIVEGARKS